MENEVEEGQEGDPANLEVLGKGEPGGGVKGEPGERGGKGEPGRGRKGELGEGGKLEPGQGLLLRFSNWVTFCEISSKMRWVVFRDEEKHSHWMQLGIWGFAFRQFYCRNS